MYCESAQVCKETCCAAATSAPNRTKKKWSNTGVVCEKCSLVPNLPFGYGASAQVSFLPVFNNLYKIQWHLWYLRRVTNLPTIGLFGPPVCEVLQSSNAMSSSTALRCGCQLCILCVVFSTQGFSMQAVALLCTPALLPQHIFQAFWELFAKHRFSDMPDRTSIHVFKDDIQPLWEDPKNLCGGHFKLIAKSQHTTESAWLDVVLNLIGEQFPHRDLVVCPLPLADASPACPIPALPMEQYPLILPILSCVLPKSVALDFRFFWGAKRISTENFHLEMTIPSAVLIAVCRLQGLDGVLVFMSGGPHPSDHGWYYGGALARARRARAGHLF